MKCNLIAAAILFAATTSEALAQAGVPVTDMGTNAAVNAVNTTLQQVNQSVGMSGQAVAEAVSANEKAMTNLNQTLANIITASARAQASTAEMRRNADLYDPSMGAKARPSCGMMAATSSLRAGDQARELVAMKAQDISEKHVTRSAYMERGEDMNTDRGARLVTLDNQKKIVSESYGSEAISTYSTTSLPTSPADGDGPIAWQVVQNSMVNMAVPNPISITPEERAAGVTQKGAASVGPKLIQEERQKMVADAVADYVADRAATYDSSFVMPLLEATDANQLPFDRGSLKDLTTGHVGRLEAMRILSTFRLRDAAWIAQTTGAANETGLLRDQNLMMAQMIELQYEIAREAKRTNLLLANIYGHAIEQSGAPKNYTNNQ